MTSRDVDSNNCPKQTCKISAGWNPGVIDPGGIGNPRSATRKSAPVRVPRNWDLLTVGFVITLPFGAYRTELTVVSWKWMFETRKMKTSYARICGIGREKKKSHRER